MLLVVNHIRDMLGDWKRSQKKFNFVYAIIRNRQADYSAVLCRATGKKAYLFGSYSREEAGRESDIDILVELDYSRHIGLGFVQMQLDLEQILHKKVDLVSAGGVSSHISPYIEKDKQLIYAR